MAKKLAFLTLLLGLLQSVTSSAQQYYLNLTGTYKSTNSAGVVTTTRMSAPSIVNEIIPDAGLARGHSLMFDVASGEVNVVQRSTGENMGAWFVFTSDTSVDSGDRNKSEVYFTITCPVDEGYQGTGVGTVLVTRDGEGQILRFKMSGKFTLRFQDANGGSPRVFSGVFSTGAKYVAPSAP